jgi:hypothetical protein
MLARYIFYLIVVLLTAAVLSDDGSSSEGGSTVTVEPENKAKAKLRASHTNVNNIGSTSQADISSTMSTNSNSGKDIFVPKVKAKPIAYAARSINKGEQDMSSQLKVPLEDVFSSPTTITKDGSNIPQQPSFVPKVAKRKARPKRKPRASSIAAARTNGGESSQQQPMSPLTDVPSNPTTNNNNNNNNGGGTTLQSTFAPKVKARPKAKPTARAKTNATIPSTISTTWSVHHTVNNSSVSSNTIDIPCPGIESLTQTHTLTHSLT